VLVTGTGRDRRRLGAARSRTLACAEVELGAGRGVVRLGIDGLLARIAWAPACSALWR
jgi:hypothetical protein